ncbi:hypothetical protein H681_23135 [Pseudomonas sp. ATCC 13867]|uniref:hypothetical protein n=1 Tax=Pseudomonas sp. ATCC 13867 TaxID=1294143 RepID=UPI0002C4DD6E|nr:hypothetical protein [Pseudomonas sp. ATCC 13867]AGI26494.1 hypothetical protein H681_23135 [Pseudomonas sp. ATCC 13867]RFQ21415.1 hypothetical protein D0N87_24095 [Pseudomonas sp. ATCC 13867]
MSTFALIVASFLDPIAWVIGIVIGLIFKKAWLAALISAVAVFGVSLFLLRNPSDDALIMKLVSGAVMGLAGWKLRKLLSPLAKAKGDS